MRRASIAASGTPATGLGNDPGGAARGDEDGEPDADQGGPASARGGELLYLADFERAIERLSQGLLPEGKASVEAAVKDLAGQICCAPWQTPAERERAQALVARLYRLLRPKPTSGNGPATADMPT